MAEGFPPGNIFCDMEGKDGYHAVKVQCGQTVTLACLAYSGGEQCMIQTESDENDSVSILKADLSEPAKVASLDRLHLVLSAIARYLNTGGDWSTLQLAAATMRDIAIGGLQFPGYHLLSSTLTDDGYQHIFVEDGTTNAVLWQEPEYGDSGMPVGGWIDPTTLEKIKEQQENDETIWGDPEAAEEGDDDTREYGSGEAED